MRFYCNSDSELKGGGGEEGKHEFKDVKHVLTKVVLKQYYISKVVIELIHPLAQFCGSYTPDTVSYLYT